MSFAAMLAAAGVLLLSAIDTAINVMGLEPSYMQVIRGGPVLLALLLDPARSAIRRRYLQVRDGPPASRSVPPR